MDAGSAHTPPPHATKPRRRLLLILLGGALLAVVAGGVIAAVLLGAPERSTPGTGLPPAVAPPTIAPGDTAAVFLGDSYTQGWGASDPGTRWSALVAHDAGWVEVNQGQGGTGFVTTSGLGGCGLAYCPTYPERVADIVDTAPDIVVIAGGQNDLTALAADPAAVRDAVDDTYDRMRRGLPDARLIAVGTPSSSNSTSGCRRPRTGWAPSMSA
jgi:hypothetical protein